MYLHCILQYLQINSNKCNQQYQFYFTILFNQWQQYRRQNRIKIRLNVISWTWHIRETPNCFYVGIVYSYVYFINLRYNNAISIVEDARIKLYPNKWSTRKNGKNKNRNSVGKKLGLKFQKFYLKTKQVPKAHLKILN